jgi:hypothetical protein
MEPPKERKDWTVKTEEEVLEEHHTMSHSVLSNANVWCEKVECIVFILPRPSYRTSDTKGYDDRRSRGRVPYNEGKK